MYRISLNAMISFVRKNSRRATTLLDERLSDIQTDTFAEPVLLQQ